MGVMEEQRVGQLQPTTPVSPKKFPWKKLILILLILLLVSGGAYAVWAYQNNRFPFQKAASQTILQVTEAVLKSMEDKRFEDALPHFIYGGENQGTREDILTALALIELSYRENGDFNPHTSLENVEVVGEKGQALVEFTVDEQRATVRFNFRKVAEIWKIESITAGGELNLIETE